MPSPRRLSTTSRLWHPRPSIGASDWTASMAGGKARTATSTRAEAVDQPRSPTARPSGTNRMTLRLASPRWRYWESGANPTRPKSHRPGTEGRPLNPSAVGGIVAASTAPTLMTRRNAIQLTVHRRRATRPATASAITVVMANPGRNHGRTPARALKVSPAEEFRRRTGLSDAAWSTATGNHREALIKVHRPGDQLTGIRPPVGSVVSRAADSQTRIAVRMGHSGESWPMTVH